MGCKSEIEDLKSEIATLKKNSILQPVGVVYTPDITESRAKELETEAEQLRKKMTKKNAGDDCKDDLEIQIFD